MERTLHGSCACGRNHYVVEVPSASDQLASILFDSSLRTRRHQATPFTAFLRVPLSWYHSSASPFFPDEPLSLIRRTFYDPPAINTDNTTASASATSSANQRRQFCGYCGTPLSSWHERTRADADFISLTLGTLRDGDVRALEDMGLFSSSSSSSSSGSGGNGNSGSGSEDDEGVVMEGSRQATPTPQPSASAGEGGGEKQAQAAPAPRKLRREVFGPLQVTPGAGAPWFERLVENSRLGRINRTRGGYAAEDGSYREEWEVVEWTAGGEEEMEGMAGTPGKRKLGQE